MNQFYEIAHFPSVIGCIDCIHIHIVNPGGNNGEIFRNRKGWFSLNVQVYFLIKRRLNLFQDLLFVIGCVWTKSRNSGHSCKTSWFCT